MNNQKQKDSIDYNLISDVITLLLALGIILFAMSFVDRNKTNCESEINTSCEELKSNKVFDFNSKKYDSLVF